MAPRTRITPLPDRSAIAISHPPLYCFIDNIRNENSAQRRRKHCALAVRRTHKQTNKQTNKQTWAITIHCAAAWLARSVTMMHYSKTGSVNRSAQWTATAERDSVYSALRDSNCVICDDTKWVVELLTAWLRHTIHFIGLELLPTICTDALTYYFELYWMNSM